MKGHFTKQTLKPDCFDMDKPVTAVLEGGKENGYTVENVKHDTITTVFSRYKKTDRVTDKGYVIYIYEDKK